MTFNKIYFGKPGSGLSIQRDVLKEYDEFFHHKNRNKTNANNIANGAVIGKNPQEVKPFNEIKVIK